MSLRTLAWSKSFVLSLATQQRLPRLSTLLSQLESLLLLSPRLAVSALGSELINFLASDNTILIRFSKGIGIMRRNLFWLNDEQWARIKPHLPTDVRGVERVDDRRVISGIVHVLKSGGRWSDCPPEYGPPTTIYNRFVRWARRGLWENLFRELAGCGRSADTQMIDSTHVKAHRSASGGKGGRKTRLWAVRAEGATRRYTHSQMLRGA